MNKKLASAMCVAAAMAAAGNAGAAWPFGGSKAKASEKDESKQVVMPPQAGQPVAGAATNAAGPGMMRRVHIRFDSDEAERDFLVLAEARRRVQEDLRVLRRILGEKRLEIARFQEELKGEFSIDPQANYQFDDDTKTIYLLTPKAGAETNAEGVVEARFEKSEHLAIGSDEQRTRFLRLVSAKQLANDELTVLGLLENEKEIEANTVHEQMVARFAISNDREYRYDRKAKILYELVPVPAGMAVGAGEAAAQ